MQEEHNWPGGPGGRPPLNLDVLAKVETDAVAAAQSLSLLTASVRNSLEKVTTNSLEHMRCHADAAGHLQQAALDAASTGNRFVNESLRLNEEMRGVAELAAQLKALRKTLADYEAQANRYLPRG